MINTIIKYLIEQEIIDKESRINIDFLGEDATQFAIEQVPVNPILEKYVDGSSYRQLQFQLVSCNDYGEEKIQNQLNSEFYENFYNLIESKNKEKVLPDIPGIDSIECLDNGAIVDTTTNTARYSILMRITYFKTK
jgi:hypothetical protein